MDLRADVLTVPDSVAPPTTSKSSNRIRSERCVVQWAEWCWIPQVSPLTSGLLPVGPVSAAPFFPACSLVSLTPEKFLPHLVPPDFGKRRRVRRFSTLIRLQSGPVCGGGGGGCWVCVCLRGGKFEYNDINKAGCHAQQFCSGGPFLSV